MSAAGIFPPPPSHSTMIVGMIVVKSSLSSYHHCVVDCCIFIVFSLYHQCALLRSGDNATSSTAVAPQAVRFDCCIVYPLSAYNINLIENPRNYKYSCKCRPPTIRSWPIISTPLRKVPVVSATVEHSISIRCCVVESMATIPRIRARRLDAYH